MRADHLLRNICALSRADREWILASLPEDVRHKLLFKLTHFIESDVKSSGFVSEKFTRSMEIVCWVEYLQGVRSDRVNKGISVPEKLFAFIREKYCK